MAAKNKNKWYIGGLHFECDQCSNCCSGPEEGYIWITKSEIEMLAEYLNESVDSIREKYLFCIGNRTTIKEEMPSHDCIFLTDNGCAIYSVRPNQCRIWPFWTTNLQSEYDWNITATTCPGINRGKLYTLQEIEAQRKQKKWWPDENKK